MTKVVQRDGERRIVLAHEDEDVCTACGAVAELRPYGPGGEAKD